MILAKLWLSFGPVVALAGVFHAMYFNVAHVPAAYVVAFLVWFFVTIIAFFWSMP